MKYSRFGDKLVVRIDRGEEIIEQLKKICRKENIFLGQITGLGAVEQATVGFFDPETQLYHSVELKDDYEITSLIGNITQKQGEVYLHVHINLSDDNHRTWGGHLNSAIVSATCEITIIVFEGLIERIYDDDTGLNLLKL